ncbi:hypothetical protein H072_10204 [Dactylellina haptotyla CBS 200.50]|uniref:Uncharacterized protein n=1 Tax=Dactylellina haptotyla (strain CBS 200.50) TaxID=1284197 RepID=S7ZZY4_DACHA|nr:hypothetical protein H072_10204 [Dactylellina haptotyla CBS 200.50]
MASFLFSTATKTFNSIPPSVKNVAIRVGDIALAYVILRVGLRVSADIGERPIPEAWPSKWCDCDDCYSHPRARQHFLERQAQAENGKQGAENNGGIKWW